MTDDRFTPRPIAGWYWLGAAISLLFAVAAGGLYVLHEMTDPVTLTLDQRTVFESEPVWVIGAFGVGAMAEAFGTVMLLARRKIAQPLTLMAVIAFLVWLAGFFADPKLRAVIGANDAAVAIAIVAIAWKIFWFARHSVQRGWLR
jgi:hypothetical protein